MYKKRLKKTMFTICNVMIKIAIFSTMAIINLDFSNKQIIPLKVSESCSAFPNSAVLVKPNSIWIRENNKENLILSLNSLPKASNIAKGLSLGSDRFTQAILSPDGNSMAFAVDGFHGWSGIYDLRKNKVFEAAFIFQGSITRLSFSLKGQYLAIESKDAGGFSSMIIWDTKGKKNINWDVPKCISGFPFDVRLKEWVDNTLKIRMKCMDDKEWQTGLLKIESEHIVFRKLDKGED